MSGDVSDKVYKPMRPIRLPNGHLLIPLEENRGRGVRVGEIGTRHPDYDRFAADAVDLGRDPRPRGGARPVFFARPESAGDSRELAKSLCQAVEAMFAAAEAAPPPPDDAILDGGRWVLLVDENGELPAKSTR